MNKKTSHKNASPRNVAETGPSIREDARREAPPEAGLASLDVARAQYERDRRELAHEPDFDPPEPGLDPTLPTNPAYGEPGHQVPDAPNEDEDEEGRTIAEQLVEEGAEQAERDTVNRAGRGFPARRISPNAHFTD
jgi:hypothetical protein